MCFNRIGSERVFQEQNWIATVFLERNWIGLVFQEQDWIKLDCKTGLFLGSDLGFLRGTVHFMFLGIGFVHSWTFMFLGLFFKGFGWIGFS